MALVLWFLLLLSPCFLITLASQGEIVIPLGGAPNQSLRLWLVSEADQRGLVLSLPSISRSTDALMCVQTQTRFFLWAGRAEEDVYYCECYSRDSAAAEWALISADTGACAELE